MITIGKNGQDFVIIDHDQGRSFYFNRGEAKAICRLIMLELNIVSATLNDGRKIEDLDLEFKREAERRHALNPDNKTVK